MRKTKSYIIIDQHINYTLNGCIMIDTQHYLIQYKDWEKIKQSIKSSKNVISYEETHFGDTLHYSTERGKYTLTRATSLSYKMYNKNDAFTIPESEEPIPQDHISDMYW